jgi:co-chaperonin GroES (HSP10)
MTIKRVLGLRILVERLPQEIQKTEAGIELIAATRPHMGKVFIIGDEVNFALGEKGIAPLQVGDVILYDLNEYPFLNSDGKDYELITVQPVICVL